MEEQLSNIMELNPETKAAICLLVFFLLLLFLLIYSKSPSCPNCKNKMSLGLDENQQVIHYCKNCEKNV